MKKFILVIFILVIPINVKAISASSMIMMDTDNNRIISGYNYDNERLIASISKIMTALVAVTYGDIDNEVVVTEKIKESFGSSIYLTIGEKISLKDLLYGLMLRSGNDAALMIAESVSSTEEQFVYLMNEQANKIGMHNTIFINPHGLENDFGRGNTSTSLDMALLTSFAIKNDMFRKIFATKRYIAKSDIKSYDWHNKNKLLKYDYITGGKTGYTDRARRTLVSTASKDNMNFVIVTLNDPNDWKDHKDLYDRAYNNYKSIKVINKDKFKINDENYYKDNRLFIKNNYYMTLSKKERNNILLNINIIKYDKYNNDDVVGYINVTLDKVIYHKEPIYIEKINPIKKLSWWDKLKGLIIW